MILNYYLLTYNLTYQIKAENVYENFFEFSNFSKDSKFYDNQNEMVVGKIKVVYRGVLINIFVGLK